MIYFQRALRKTLSGKQRDTDIIIRSSIDKLRRHILCRFQPVRLQIFGQHTGRNVYGKHYINTFYFAILPTIGCLRPGQNKNNQCQSNYSQCKRYMQQIVLITFRGMRIYTSVRNLKRSFTILPFHDIPYYIRYKQQQ